MFSSSIRTLCLFKSSIVLVPSSPRLGAEGLMTALILLTCFVNPLFSPSDFCNFLTILSLNSHNCLCHFSAVHFPVLLGWEDPNLQKKYIHCQNLHIHFFSLCSNLFVELFFVWTANFYVSFGIFFLGILQIYLRAVLWCGSLVCAWRPMINNILCSNITVLESP